MKFPIGHFNDPSDDSLSKGRYRHKHIIDSVMYYYKNYQYKYDVTCHKLQFYE